MVQALFGVEKYNEVIPLASWIIAVNPATTETRYLRAVAFQAQKMYANASADYKKCLEQDKTMTKCIQALDQLDDLWDAEDDDEWSDMSPCTAMHDLECASDSDDSRHDGNGTPCIMYNHDGCKYEIQCRFKHSADSRSVRDNLGQNVCLFWLIGRCYFVNKARPCWYSHSKKYLPANGWWNNDEYIEFYRDFYDTFKPISDDQTLDKVMGRDMNGQWHPWEQASKLAEAFEEFDSLQHQNKLLQRDLEHLIDDVRGRPHRVFRNNKLHSRLYYENSKVGFTRQDVMELAMQGVMPWEDDAADVLAVLNGHY
ncbi:hypothetical protein DL96DRAFT_1817686 [Flagelloscypha sp. PMI_526]|nr:hypothetical protein DL96DRAFT_1817686 [Flagelloscypha sp. PMI_526]